MEPTTTENQTLREIAAGKYRHCYLLYARRSTDEPNNQKNSLTYQRAENGKFAERERLPIAPLLLKSFCVDGIISERHSGFEEDNNISINKAGMVQYRIERPKFHQLIGFLSRGLFRGVIVLCWDRISRNGGDDTVIRKLMKSGIDIRFVYAKYDNTSSGALHMDIDGMFAQHHSRVTSEKVRINTQNLRERGVCTYKAPIGYLNQGNMEHKAFDPVRAPLIKRMFEIVAKENWTISEVTTWATRQGLTTVPMRRRRTPEELLAEEEDMVPIEPISRLMTNTFVHKILTNTFYIGKIRDGCGGFSVSTSHDPLITEELFNKVQAVLKRRRVSVRYTEKVDLPYRGLVRCGDCRHVYTPYIQKGIQYFSSRCRQNCPNRKKNINAAFLERGVAQLLERLSFSDQELADIEELDKTTGKTLEEKRQQQHDEQGRRERKVREDLSYLKDNKLSLLKTGVYLPDQLLAEERRLTTELAELEALRGGSERPLNEIVSEMIKLSELVKYGSAYYSFANSREKDQIMRTLYSELLVSQSTLISQCKNGFKALESRFWAQCGQSGWLSELVRNDNSVKESIDELKEILAKQDSYP